MTTKVGMGRPVTLGARLRRSPALCVTLACVMLLMTPALGAPPAGSDKNLQKHYGLIFGTAYGPDDQPLHGVRVQIHPAGRRRPTWDLVSDHRGEFAQRVPPGPGDYLVTGEAEILLPGKDKDNPHHTQKKRVKVEAKVHLEGEERQDLSLHLTN